MVEGHEKTRGFERKHSIYFQDGHRKCRTPEIPYRAEMTGDSCLARAVVPRKAAAVDHADTELIEHDGQLETPGFFVVE